MSSSVAELWQAIEQYKLVPAREAAALQARWFRPGRKETENPERFGHWLVMNGFLTEFMVQVLRGGKAEQLLLGQYRLRDKLLEGPYAGAYLALDALDTPVILEILAADRAADMNAVLQFHETVQKAIQLRHPNVARVIDAGMAHGWQFLVREFCEGETLGTVLHRRGKLSTGQAARLFALALAGLQAVHDQGIPGGDLCPEDVLLTPADKVTGQRTVKLLHVGFRRKLFDASVVGRDGGGFEMNDLGLSASVHLLPLQATDSTADDLFRIGCLFYQSLAGKPPFPPGEPPGVALSLGTAAPDVPEMLAEVVDGLIHPDGSRRTRKASHAAKALRVFLAADDEEQSPRAEDRLATPGTYVQESLPVPPPPPHYEPDPPPRAERVARPPSPRRAQPVAREKGEAPTTLSAKWEDLWTEYQPNERDLVCMAIGVVTLILLVLVLKLLTGFTLVNVVFLMTGASISFLLERLGRWLGRRRTRSAKAALSRES